MSCDIGRRGELWLVPGDEDAVLGDHQVRLDDVRPQPDRELVGGQRVFRPVADRAPVPEDQRSRPGGSVSMPVRLRARRGDASDATMRRTAG
jgi:hypothetical protein